MRLPSCRLCIEYYSENFDLSYEHHGEKGSYSEYGRGWASTSMTPFSNFKGSAAEGGVRAQLIVRYPKVVAQGERSDAFVYLLDVVPTLLDLAGVKPRTDAGAPMTYVKRNGVVEVPDGFNVIGQAQKNAARKTGG